MHLLARIMLMLGRRSVKTVLSLLLTLALGLMVIATIYFTLFDLQWLAFLGGILFAAVLSMASQASKAEWLIIRRTTQLERAREDAKREALRRKISEDAMRANEIRSRMVKDELPVPILFVDRDLRIHNHNKAVRELTRLPQDRIDNQLLRDVMGTHYTQMLPHCREALTGNRDEYPLTWANDNTTFKVKHVPHPPGESKPLGFYILMLPETRHQPAAAKTPASVPAPASASISTIHNDHSAKSDPHAAITGEGGETMYLHALSDQLMGGDDPRTKLLRALKQDEFLLYAQKIQPLKPLALDYGNYEILLRLQEEEDNLLPPGGFIPIAERCGLTEEIDRWVVRTVINWSLEQRRASPDWNIPMFCLNLSEASIVNPEFAHFVRRELQRSGFPAKQLCFEIGELETISNHESVGHFIAALKPAGCRFTVDSFGSIKLSFMHLSGLAVDFIKIDGVIIQNMFKTEADLTKLRAIVNVCSKLGVRTIAEFVEDERTLAKLREIGIDYAQGFGIDRPGPIAKAR